MRAVIQRVREAGVAISGSLVGHIGQGLLIFLGVGEADTEADADYLAAKIPHLRIFPDEASKFNRSLLEVQGELLVVSQFTLWGDCRKGRRPSFSRAARPEEAERLYQYFVDQLKYKGISVDTGIFGEMMEVSLVNDGPVTLILDSDKVF